jgi:hypothetical protein
LVDFFGRIHAKDKKLGNSALHFDKSLCIRKVLCFDIKIFALLSLLTNENVGYW